MDAEWVSKRPSGLLAGVARPANRAQIAQDVPPATCEWFDVIDLGPVGRSAYPAPITPVENLFAPLPWGEGECFCKPLAGAAQSPLFTRPLWIGGNPVLSALPDSILVLGVVQRVVLAVSLPYVFSVAIPVSLLSFAVFFGIGGASVAALLISTLAILGMALCLVVGMRLSPAFAQFPYALCVSSPIRLHVLASALRVCVGHRCQFTGRWADVSYQ